MRIIVPLVSLLVLLAGCSTPSEDLPDAGDPLPDGTGGAPGFARQEGHDRATDGGIIVEGDMYACEGGFCIDAEARNDGDRTHHVSAICVSPWSDRMERDGQDVQHVEPRAHCAAFGTEPFPPGAHLEAAFAWNATVWDGQRLEPAPGGAYQWSVSFVFYDDADGQGPHTLELSFTVVVGQT